MIFKNRHSNLAERMDSELKENPLSDKMIKNMLSSIGELPEEDTAEKFMLYGILNAYKENIPKMHENFSKALELAPDDPVILYNYGQALYKNSLYSQAVLCLQKMPELNSDCAKTIGLCCQALGLHGKARQFLENLEEEGKNCKEGINCSKCGQDAINAVLQSFDEERDIWQSLSTR